MILMHVFLMAINLAIIIFLMFVRLKYDLFSCQLIATSLPSSMTCLRVSLLREEPIDYIFSIIYNFIEDW